jgi:hypothetical protein
MKKLLLLSAILLCSCGADLREKIAIAGEPQWRIESLSRVRVTVEAKNSSRHTIHLSEGRFTLDTPDGRTLATILLTDTVTLPKRTTTHLEFPLRIKLHDPLAILSPPTELTISGSAKLRSGPFHKKIKLQNKPINKLLTQ